MEVRGLVDITTTYVARFITDMRSEEGIKKHFNLIEPLTPEQLAEVWNIVLHLILMSQNVYRRILKI